MPVLTFPSDRRLADSHVAEVKGAILSLDPAAARLGTGRGSEVRVGPPGSPPGMPRG